MRKGKHRRHRDARKQKLIDGEAAGKALGFVDEDSETACDECRRVTHAEWCHAETKTEQSLTGITDFK